MISNLTGRCVFWCMTVARLATREPTQMSAARNFVRSNARNLLSMARLNMARSLVLDANCRRIRIAQISLSLSGRFLTCQLSLVPRCTPRAADNNGFHDGSLFDGRRSSLRPAPRGEVRPDATLRLAHRIIRTTLERGYCRTAAAEIRPSRARRQPRLSRG